MRRQKAKQEKEAKNAEALSEKRRQQEQEDIRFMREAIRQAKKAGKLSEVPIGCVLVHDGEIVARGYNRRNTDKTTLAHAEIAVIRKASRVFGDWRLENCTLYVTLEPCPMCAGAIVQARIPRVVAGCMNPKAGCAGSVLNILDTPGLNHRVKFEKGVLEKECSELLRDFFRGLRLNGRKIEK
ncbi:MAG: tRNA adenosine(34) deaminase TadA [Lachnospiraceae bacterium]|nr:tRNA adenosine(34) deaminase TadA [Lachnospiraceae bacterium]